MIKRIGGGNNGRDHRRRSANRQLKQRLRRFTRQVISQPQQAILVGLANLLQPFLRHAVTQQIAIGDLREKRRLGRSLLLPFHVDGNRDFLNRLPHFNQLGSAGLGMGFQPAPLRPLIGVIVMIDVTQH